MQTPDLSGQILQETFLGLAKTIINDYNATSCDFREPIKSVDRKQEGDPETFTDKFFSSLREKVIFQTVLL